MNKLGISENMQRANDRDGQPKNTTPQSKAPLKTLSTVPWREGNSVAKLKVVMKRPNPPTPNNIKPCDTRHTLPGHQQRALRGTHRQERVESDGVRDAEQQAAGNTNDARREGEPARTVAVKKEPDEESGDIESRSRKGIAGRRVRRVGG